MRADAAGADPHDLAGRAQLVEQAWVVVVRRAAASTSVSSTDAGMVAPCSCADDVERARRCRARPSPTPCHAGRNRANVSASTGSTSRRSRGERSAPQPAQHLDVAPLALEAVGPELAGDDTAERLEPVERAPHRIDRDAEPVARRRPTRNGPCVRAYRATRSASGIGHRFDEGAGEAARYGGAKRIAEPRCVLGRGHPGLPGDPYRDRPVFGYQRSQQRRRRQPVDIGSRASSSVAQVAEVAQQVVQVVGAAHASPVGRQPLQLELQRGERVGVDELA